MPESASNPVILRPHPFAQDPGFVQVAAGQTLAQMLEGIADGEPVGLTLRVEVGGREVPRALWSRVRPKLGVAIHVTRMPAGGDGGAKKWLRAILMIVVMVVAWYVVGPAMAGKLGMTAAQWAGAAYMVGSLRMPALTPEIR